MAVGAARAAPAAAVPAEPAASGWRDWRLPLGIAAALAVLTLIPYAYAHLSQPSGQVFMGFFFLGDDANTYLAKMRQGWEGGWIWTNRYSTEASPGAFFFVFWLLLGKLAWLLHLSMLGTFHLAMFLGAFALLACGWMFIRHFVDDPPAQRFALWFMAVGLGMGYVVYALGKPVILGQQTDTLDWRMPELTAFYSILALPHFAWAAAFQAVAAVLTLRAAERGSLTLGALAGLGWLGESSIHAQMPLLLGAAVAVALVARRVSARGYLAAVLAFAIAAPYVGYSYYESLHSPEVLRWSAQWRNNLPPDGFSLFWALAPQLLLAAAALPGALRRRSREDVFLLAWLLLLAYILWFPNPAGNLRRRFFDGVYLPLVVLAARGMYEQVVPRLRSLRARRLVPFGYVNFAAVGAAFLLLAPMLHTTPAAYVTRSEYDALSWLGGQPGGVVLSTAAIGLYVPAYSPDTVYVGQYSETYNYFQKAVQAQGLVSGSGDLQGFVAANHVRYVFWSQASGGPPPDQLGAPAFSEPGTRVYKLY